MFKQYGAGEEKNLLAVKILLNSCFYLLREALIDWGRNNINGD